MRSHEVPAQSRRQRGTFTKDQALEAGWSSRQIARRTATGAWVRMAGRALAGSSLPRTAPAVAWAVHLTWPHAVVGGATAGPLHGFPLTRRTRQAVPAIAVLPRDTGRSVGVGFLREEVPSAERWLTDDVVVLTAPRRTAIDCLATLDRDEAGSLLAWLITRKIITRQDIGDGLDRYRSRKGFAQLRGFFDLTRAGALSEAEELCHAVLDRSGITGWRANLTIRDDRGPICVGDVVFEEQQVIIEVDGWASHGDRVGFERDRRTQTRLVAAGWVVIRVTWAQLSEDPVGFARSLRRALDRRSRIRAL